MSEASSPLSPLVIDVADDVYRLSLAGRLDEVRRIIARLLPREAAAEEAPNYSPDRPALWFRGIVGQLTVKPEGEHPQVEIVPCPERAKRAMKKFATLAGVINASLRNNDRFPDANGVLKPAQDLSVEELVRETGDSVLTRMAGWIRVEEVPSIRLD